jgi:hypothetical protein
VTVRSTPDQRQPEQKVFEVEDRDLVRRALVEYRDGTVDFSDT